jgi:hypothetical protein
MRFLKAAVLAMSVIAASVGPSRAVTVLGNLGGGTGIDPTATLSVGPLNPGTSIDVAYNLTLLPGATFDAALIDASGKISPLEVELWSGLVGVGTVVASATGPIAAVISYTAPSTGLYQLELIATEPTGKNLPQNFTLGGDASTTGGGITSTVPEPATWALMGIGFACLSFLAYRRKGNRTGLRFA